VAHPAFTRTATNLYRYVEHPIDSPLGCCVCAVSLTPPLTLTSLWIGRIFHNRTSHRASPSRRAYLAAAQDSTLSRSCSRRLKNRGVSSTYVAPGYHRGGGGGSPDVVSAVQARMMRSPIDAAERAFVRVTDTRHGVGQSRDVCYTLFFPGHACDCRDTDRKVLRRHFPVARVT